MAITLTAAARQYATRPPDERYPTLEALQTAAQVDKNLAFEATRKLGTLAVEVGTRTGAVDLRGANGHAARLTHWAFAQVARLIGTTAAYLGLGSPALVEHNLREGLARRGDDNAGILLRRGGPTQPHTLRAITGSRYGRVWDADLYAAVQEALPGWSLPPTWTGEPAGAYRGDRDSFLILTHGGSIVDDPTLAGHQDSRLFRGVMIHNSEVGANAVSIAAILYRYICGNHMIWGASVVEELSYRRRHVGRSALEDMREAVARIGAAWSDRPAGADQALIATLARLDVASTTKLVVAELRQLGVPDTTATHALASAEANERQPRSYWGVAQGLTRISQASGHQNARLALDSAAGALLRQGQIKAEGRTAVTV
jgi:hypothetical protein